MQAIERRLAPGPSLWEMFKALPRLRKDPFGELVKAREQYGDILRFRLDRVAHLICHPDHMEHIYLKNAKNYLVRGKEFYEVEPLVGTGVLLANGDLWARQRRTISKEFTAQTVKSFGPLMAEHAQRTVDRWERELGDKPRREMTDEMMALTLGIAADVFFGTHVENVKAIGEAVDVHCRLATKRIRALVKLPRGCPLPSHNKADRATKKLDEIIYGLMRDYEKERPAKTNVLSRLMDGREKQGMDSEERMSDQLLRDEIVTILISGHETTASLLFWTLYLLDQSPEVEKKLYEAIRETIGDRPPAAADLETLTYPGWVLREGLRLYPAFANLSKEVAKDDEIGGFFIPRGSSMNVCVWLTHRHPDFWPDPERFDPERYNPQNSAARHRYSWLPFGEGPRACIGEHFAMLEAQLLLILLVQRFRFRLVPGHVVRPTARITTFPEKGIPMVLERRR